MNKQKWHEWNIQKNPFLGQMGKFAPILGLNIIWKPLEGFFWNFVP